MKRTKIVCTLGPATDDPEVLKNLFLAGMDVGRLNFSHGAHEDHYKRAEEFKRVREELKRPAGLLLDTKGPEIRIKKFKNGKVVLEKGKTFILTTDEIDGDEERVSITYKDLPADLTEGNRVLIADGLIELKVTSIRGGDIVCEILNGGELSDRKGVNVPGVTTKLPFMNDNDRNDILFGIKNDFDFIAASFSRSADDIKEMKDFIESNGGGFIKLISKIENHDGVRNIDEIIRVSDGIMVARGDMGVEIPFEEIPHLQKLIIKKSLDAGKPVIIATQMLESMIKNPRPTRAEITDVANAIYDGGSAIMLSAETSVGAFPVLTVETMAKIAGTTEIDINYIRVFEHTHINISKNVTNAIGYATCSAAHSLDASAIITITQSGHTSRMISRYRPSCKIIASTPSKKVYNQLALSWGVFPVMTPDARNTDEIFESVVQSAIDENMLSDGDLVVITGGMPLGMSGTTNMIKVHIVGDILLEGKSLNGLSSSGVLCVMAEDKSSLADFRGGDILVIKKSSDPVLHLIKNSSGVITEEDSPDSPAAIVAKALDIPVIISATKATERLISGIAVKLDGETGRILSGHGAAEI
jgi:pyruvate kinase